MLISEIFTSIDGEAKRAGEIATFIRSVGCPLRCKYCDSTYTWGMDETSREMTVSEIVDKCKDLGVHNITFTGGEPLIQKDADELIETLAHEGFDIGIETCGAVDFTTRPWFIENNPNVWVCSDYKCYTSGEESSMLSLDKFVKLRPQDVLKFVVGSKDDLDLAHSVITTLRNAGCNCFIYLSPVFGDIEPKQIVEYMMKYKLENKIRFQLQIHKFVWDPNKRGV